MAKIVIEGMKELEKSIKQLGELPQKYVTKAAKAGANIAKKSAKKGSWIDQTGNLRKGIILKGERYRSKWKKVYDIMMDPKMNEVFQKKAAHAKRLRVYHGYNRDVKDPRMELKEYYYPASQEYGFKTRSGGYVPGFHFLREGLTKNAGAIEKKTVDVLAKEVDKALKG